MREAAGEARSEAKLPLYPTHVATIDLEDWYQDVEGTGPDPRGRDQAAFVRQLTAVLEILGETRTRCTFFVLGRTAERYPEWVARIRDEGHEIASHGYGHALVSELTQTEFERDLVRAVECVESITGERPLGYRAPYFSLTPDRSWVYEVLAAHGFEYSSSVLPFSGWRAGSPGHPIETTDIRCSNGVTVREYPVSVSSMGRIRVPVAGGGFWRALPTPVICWGVRRAEREDRPFIFYLHPHEFDREPLKSHRGFARNLYVNAGRRSIPGKLRGILLRHRFGSFRELVGPSSHRGAEALRCSRGLAGGGAQG